MTCIVGVKDGGRVYMGGDSAAVDGLLVSARKDPKVFINGDFLMGVSGSFRFGQIMRFAFQPPRHKSDKTDYEFMCVDFIKRMQKTFREHGFDGKAKNMENYTSGQMLVGYNGELYEFYGDYQIGIATAKYNAMGCGMEVALGAMYALDSSTKLSPEEKIRIALDASCAFNGGVMPPYNILSI